MKFGSLFAGIGGFDLGLERAGMECAWQVEIDEWKMKVLGSHFPKAVLHADVRNVGLQNLTKVDVICGGSPCQGFSSNGGNKSDLFNTQSELIFEFGRIADELNPDYIIIENVKNILKWANVIADIFSKWSLYDKTIKANQCGGYTRRERVFIVGHLRSKGGQNIFSKSRFPSTSFETGGRRDTLPMCLPWGGGLNLERLGSTVVGTKTNPVRVRKSDGVSRRLDKVRWDALGNAVVPQVVEWIGKRIMEVENGPV